MIKILVWKIDNDFKILGQNPYRYIGDTCKKLETIPDIRVEFVSGTFFECLSTGLKDMKDEDKLLLIKDIIPLIRPDSLSDFIRQSLSENRGVSFLFSHSGEDLDLIGDLASKFSSLAFVRADILKETLAGLKDRDLKAKDFYGHIAYTGDDISLHTIDDCEELLILQSNSDRAHMENELSLMINLDLMESGVVMENPESIHIEPDVKIGEGSLIEANVRITGNTLIGRDCHIGMNSNISDSKIGNCVKIYSSFIEKSCVEDYTDIGPFARLRPNSHLMEKVHIGNFVEVKNSTVGSGTKAGHLAYVGDSDLGKNINIGCGVIFVNYDGKNKHRSQVEDGAFIGSNTNIVAPVHIDREAYVAAGSTITKDVGSGQLAIERAKQKNIDGYVEMKRERDKNK